mmetsp:Transcript_29230/g.49795  ORF Transcript_29230/g.49795 Transcript_29230/m.49795 type:complete len:314 (-) Transcript_29230:141-1082(-)
MILASPLMPVILHSDVLSTPSANMCSSTLPNDILLYSFVLPESSRSATKSQARVGTSPRALTIGYSDPYPSWGHLAVHTKTSSARAALGQRPTGPSISKPFVKSFARLASTLPVDDSGIHRSLSSVANSNPLSKSAFNTSLTSVSWRGNKAVLSSVICSGDRSCARMKDRCLKNVTLRPFFPPFFLSAFVLSSPYPFNSFIVASSRSSRDDAAVLGVSVEFDSLLFEDDVLYVSAFFILPPESNLNRRRTRFDLPFFVNGVASFSPPPFFPGVNGGSSKVGVFIPSSSSSASSSSFSSFTNKNESYDTALRGV